MSRTWVNDPMEVSDMDEIEVKKGDKTPFSYEDWLKWKFIWRDRRLNGKVVLKKEEAFWEQCRQAFHGYYMNPGNWAELAVPDWMVFIHEVRSKGGKHVHQGGICLFVLSGKGYSIVDGVKYDWEKGDCIILPLTPGGVEHQHFNENPDGPSRWMCLDYVPYHQLAGAFETEQKEVHPDWKGPKGGAK